MERAKHSFLLCPILLSCLVMNKICLNQKIDDRSVSIVRLCFNVLQLFADSQLNDHETPLKQILGDDDKHETPLKHIIGNEDEQETPLKQVVNDEDEHETPRQKLLGDGDPVHENQKPTDQEQVKASDGQSMDLGLTVHDWGNRVVEVFVDLSRAFMSDPQPRAMGPIYKMDLSMNYNIMA